MSRSVAYRGVLRKYPGRKMSGSPSPAAGIRIEKSNGFFHARTMTKRDPRVDIYIARSADFAKPILSRIRKLVHTACPKVGETIKWSSPFYEHQGILLATPAFKQLLRAYFLEGQIVFEQRPEGKTTPPHFPLRIARRQNSDRLHQKSRAIERIWHQKSCAHQTEEKSEAGRAGLFSACAQEKQKGAGRV